MSEEILKALMQLFAIISKQNSAGVVHDMKYVREFLKNQIAADKVPVYLELYNEYLNEENVTTSSLTSVKDSVRTLSICKKINKTLSHKQRIIVLFRICEFINGGPSIDPLKREIVETTAKVFNVDRAEFDRILYFASVKSVSELKPVELSRILAERSDLPVELAQCFVKKEGISGVFLFIQIQSSGTMFFKFFDEYNVNLNGLAISGNKGHILTQGATIRTSKSTIFFNEIINLYNEDQRATQIHFTARVEKHVFKGNKIALRNIEISETGGTLFGIMGGSGAGKTTLLNILSGLEPSPFSDVFLNGHKITSVEARGNIGYIPQDDLLMEDLTVYQNLYFNAKLSNKTWNNAEIARRVLKVLDDLGLLAIRDIKVGNALNKKISGGQRKRLNIALELIREPSVLFVDEPTSGLSSKDSENVMDLLKLLSQEGKLIFVVIHQPSSEIYKLFDKMFILDQGGYPVYYGNAIEAIIYFKSITNQINKEIGECISCGNVNPELIFNTIEDKELDEFGNYTNIRKISPEKWYSYFNDQHKPVTFKAEKSDLVAVETPGLLKQLGVFFSRDFLSRISDVQYLLIALLEAPALAFILSIIIRSSNNSEAMGYVYNYNENIPAYIFMLVIVSLFIGLSISAEEIYKDRRIIKREQFLQLSRFSYYNSKILYLMLLSLMQSGALCFIGNLIVGIDGMFLWYWMLSFTVFVFGNISGLVLSSSFNSIVSIYIIIPFIIIPQMILGGAMFRFDNLSKLVGGGYEVPLIADIMVSRWAYEGLMTAQSMHNQYAENYYEYDQLLSKYYYRTSYLYPKLTDMLEEKNVNNDQRNEQAAPLVVINSLKQEFLLESVYNPADKLTQPEDWNQLSIAEADTLLKMLNQLNQTRYNLLSKKKDMAIYRYDDANQHLTSAMLQMGYENENIREIVENTLTADKGYVKNDRVYQNMDQIYMTDHLITNNIFSDNPMFVPYKKAGALVMETFWYNLMVIWIYAFLCYLVLYYGWLKKLLGLKIGDLPRKNRQTS